MNAVVKLQMVARRKLIGWHGQKMTWKPMQLEPQALEKNNRHGSRKTDLVEGQSQHSPKLKRLQSEML